MKNVTCIPKYLQHMRVGYFASKISKMREVSLHFAGEGGSKIESVRVLMRITFLGFFLETIGNQSKVSCSTQFKLQD